MESYLLELKPQGLELGYMDVYNLCENSSLEKIYSDLLIADLDKFPVEIDLQQLYLKGKEMIDLKEYSF